MTNLRSPLIAAPPTPRRNYKKVAVYTVCGGVLLIFLLLTAVCVNEGNQKIAALRTEVDKLIKILKTVGESQRRHYSPEKLSPASRWVEAGVSDKAFRLRYDGGSGTLYPWTDNMLSWQRTAFHFQPLKNWMNDPNGPMFYKGWYHFFYQYNQDAAVWGRIAWGHAVSRDLINWIHLPLAMVSDQWYDANGVWTGSATILPDGSVVMVYTGSTLDQVQVQNLAFPADPSDPLLIEWVKYEGNPVLYPPPGIDSKDFRDPTTAWLTPEGKWRMAIGSRVNTTGISLVYETEDFKEYKLVERLLHGVEGTGMWECVDFYPVAVDNLNGLDTSAGGAGIKHVLKASLDEEKNDYYAVGRYQRENSTWLPEEVGLDVGVGLRYDYGKFYASKTFYDESKRRRILWGWVMETDSEAADVRKGWASLQAIPRTVALDQRTGKGIIQWPVEEVERLRRRGRSFNGVEVRGGETVALDAGSSTQLDITVEFEVEIEGGGGEEGEEEYSCENGGGAERRGELGPFGVVVHGDRERKEQTAVFFYGVRGSKGKETYFCVDQKRSSMAEEVDKGVYGNRVRVEEGEREKVRVIVDHSIVESFAQGGRTCVTSRVYPTRGGGNLMLFNNATGVKVRAWVNTWEMASATMRTFYS